MYRTEDEAREATVTAKQAAAEVMRHGFNPELFFEEIGRRETYRGSEVLDWLGY